MKIKPLMLAVTSVVVLSCGPAALPLSAQLSMPPAYSAYQPFSDQQLDQLLGPIALYPDPLLAQVLAASTFPSQIVLADRYLADGGDPTLANDQPWDPSVQALVRYPSLLQYLDDNLAWTTTMGQAFINQQSQVMESIQRLRASARYFGNLESTPQQDVVDDGDELEIFPASPDVIYLPLYQSAAVYCQSGYAPAFGFACPIGPWLNCRFDWQGHRLNHDGHEGDRFTNWRRGSEGERALGTSGRTLTRRMHDERFFRPQGAATSQLFGAPVRNRPAPDFHSGAIRAVIGTDHSRPGSSHLNLSQQNFRSAVPFQTSRPASISHSEPAVSHSTSSSVGGHGGGNGGSHGGGSTGRR